MSQVANKLPNKLIYNHRCDKGIEREAWGAGNLEGSMYELARHGARGKGLLTRGNCMCKGPEVGACVLLLRNNGKASESKSVEN